MKFLKKNEYGYVFDEYFEYLRSIKENLPENTRNFTFYDGHYDFSNKSCLHDSWVENVEIKENSSGKRHEFRSLDIHVKLLGAYHDRIHNISYIGVQKYSLDHSGNILGKQSVGHGDWLVDTIELMDDGAITHEVEFSSSDFWSINCRDIVYAIEMLN